MTDGGKDYQPGETIYLKSSDPSKNPVGSGFLARVDEVDTQNSLYKTDEEIQLGSIKKLRIIDPFFFLGVIFLKFDLVSYCILYRYN